MAVHRARSGRPCVARSPSGSAQARARRRAEPGASPPPDGAAHGRRAIGSLSGAARPRARASSTARARSRAGSIEARSRIVRSGAVTGIASRTRSSPRSSRLVRWIRMPPRCRRARWRTVTSTTSGSPPTTPPQRRRGEVAEHRAPPARQQRGELPGVGREHPVTDEIHASVNPMETPGPKPAVDRLDAEAGRAQLGAGHHSSLAPRDHTGWIDSAGGHPPPPVTSAPRGRDPHPLAPEPQRGDLPGGYRPQPHPLAARTQRGDLPGGYRRQPHPLGWWADQGEALDPWAARPAVPPCVDAFDVSPPSRPGWPLPSGASSPARELGLGGRVGVAKRDQFVTESAWREWWTISSTLQNLIRGRPCGSPAATSARSIACQPR